MAPSRSRSPVAKALQDLLRELADEALATLHLNRGEHVERDVHRALVWILKLEPGSTRTLEYDFDADIKDVEGENGFEVGG